MYSTNDLSIIDPEESPKNNQKDKYNVKYRNLITTISILKKRKKDTKYSKNVLAQKNTSNSGKSDFIQKNNKFISDSGINNESARSSQSYSGNTSSSNFNSQEKLMNLSNICYNSNLSDNNDEISDKKCLPTEFKNRFDRLKLSHNGDLTSPGGTNIIGPNVSANSNQSYFKSSEGIPTSNLLQKNFNILKGTLMQRENSKSSNSPDSTRSAYVNKFTSALSDRNCDKALENLFYDFKSLKPLVFRNDLFESDYVKFKMLNIRFRDSIIGFILLITCHIYSFIIRSTGETSMLRIFDGCSLFINILIISIMIFLLKKDNYHLKIIGICFPLSLTTIMLFQFVKLIYLLERRQFNSLKNGPHQWFFHSESYHVISMSLIISIVFFYTFNLRFYLYWLNTIYFGSLTGLYFVLIDCLVSQNWRENYFFSAIMVHIVIIIVAIMYYKYVSEKAERFDYIRNRFQKKSSNGSRKGAYGRNRKRKIKSVEVIQNPVLNVLSDIGEIGAILREFYDKDGDDEDVKVSREKLRIIVESMGRVYNDISQMRNLEPSLSYSIKNEFARSYVNDLQMEMTPIYKEILMTKRRNTIDFKSRNRTFFKRIDDPLFLGCDYLEGIGVKWDYNILQLGKMTTQPLLELGYSILQNYSRSNEVGLDLSCLVNFLSHIENSYNSLPYHNSLHGAMVCHLVFCLADLTEIRTVMTDSDEVSLAVAALTHDVGHPGKNNNFLINTNSDLALFYNDRSVLENFHSAITFQTLSEPSKNIFKKLPTEEYRLKRKAIIDLILCTDMKNHFDHLVSFKVRRDAHDFSILNNVEDMWKVGQMCIKSADIGHAASPWEQHREWCSRVVEELYSQGDRERKLGLPISFLCDRNVHITEFYKSQINFLEFVVKPLFEVLDDRDVGAGEEPGDSPQSALKYNLAKNICKWKELETETRRENSEKVEMN